MKALEVQVEPELGAEFVPRLDEGAIALQAWRVPSVSLEESVRQTTLLEKVLKQFPEVTTVISKTGRAEIATDPMGVEISDVFVIATREGLQKVGGQLSALLSKVPGAADVKAEQVAGLPVARIQIDRQAIARYGINAREVLDTVETIGGRQVGTVLEGQKRFALQVRFAASARENVEQPALLQVRSPTGQLIPLSQLAKIVVEEGPAQVSRENIQRRIAIEANVRGRDLKGFVDDAQARIAQEVKLPEGYWLDWGGQFENLEAATKRLPRRASFRWRSRLARAPRCRSRWRRWSSADSSRRRC